MIVDGEERIVSEGDCISTKFGELHGLLNNSDEDVLFFVTQVSLIK